MNAAEQIQNDLPAQESNLRGKYVRGKVVVDGQTRMLRASITIGLVLALVADVVYWIYYGIPRLDEIAQQPGHSDRGIQVLCWLGLIPVFGVMAGIWGGLFAFSLVQFFRPIYFALFRDKAQFDREYGPKKNAIEIEVSAQAGVRRKALRFPKIGLPLIFGKSYQATYLIVLGAALIFGGLMREAPPANDMFVQYVVMNPFTYVLCCPLLVSLLVLLGRVAYAATRPNPAESLPAGSISAAELLNPDRPKNHASKHLDQDIQKNAEPSTTDLQP